MGDDLYVTNLERLKKGFLNLSSNAILIKLNQIGTVSETLDVIKFAHKIGFKTSLFAKNPLNPNQKVPVYFANFVLMDYGFGAVFGCPAHDQRDLDFANKLKLPVKVVVKDKNNNYEKIDTVAYTGDGEIINSGMLNGMNIHEAKSQVIELAENKKIGKNELFIHVAKLASKLNNNGNIGLVVGATKYGKMNNIKVVSGDMPWLIPGVGFQGGSLKDSIAIGSKNSSIALINSSRSIIYAGDGSIKDIKLATENLTHEIRKIL